MLSLILVDSQVHGSRSKIIAQNIKRYTPVSNSVLYKSLVTIGARKLLCPTPKFQNIELMSMRTIFKTKNDATRSKIVAHNNQEYLRV